MSKQYEGLGEKWYTLLADPEKEIPQLVPFVMAEGGSRPTWQHATTKLETALMAWPQEASIRAAVVVQGPVGGQLKPKAACPFMEGLPNDLTVEEVSPWTSKVEGTFSARRNEDGEPLWLYNPVMFRDADMLTPGVRHTFVVSGLVMGLRRALVDEMTISEGRQYEAYAKEWLANNPTATRLDVPQLKISLEGARILAPLGAPADYQTRVPVASVEETAFANEKVYMLHVQYGMDTPNPLNIMLYAPEKMCKGFVPKAGDDIDAFFWLQARVID